MTRPRRDYLREFIQPREPGLPLFEWRVRDARRTLERLGCLPAASAGIEAYPPTIRRHGLIVCREAALLVRAFMAPGARS